MVYQKGFLTLTTVIPESPLHSNKSEAL